MAHLLSSLTFLSTPSLGRALSSLLSAPLTATLALAHLTKGAGESMVIHLVGARRLEAGGLLLWRLLGLARVTLVLVGPECPQLDTQGESSTQVRHRENFSKYDVLSSISKYFLSQVGTRLVELSPWYVQVSVVTVPPCTYEEYSTSTAFIEPDLVSPPQFLTSVPMRLCPGVRL